MKNYALHHVFITFILFFPILAIAEPEEVKIPDSLNKELNYLLEFVGGNRAEPKNFKIDKIQSLLKFLDTEKPSNQLFYPEGQDYTSAYFETKINRNLDQLLQLTENPAIPAQFTAPSSVKDERWSRVDTTNHERPLLWEILKNPTASNFYTGVEHITNTPDETTGAYYEYDLDRTLIVTQYNGRNLLISLSKQKGVSEAGKKGYILGEDTNWDYLYTQQTGLNLPGLGWANSYVYDSHSVSFYLESPEAQKPVKFGAFKWLKAGWSDINFVKRTHIYNGLNRFSSVLKSIVENPKIANNRQWQQKLAEINSLPRPQLQTLTQNYLSRLQKQVEQDNSVPAEFKETVLDDDYIKSLGQEDMRSILVLEYLKQLLGKSAKLDLSKN